MNITRRLPAAILAFAVIWAGCGGKPARRHYEKAGGFSYDPPAGWTITEFPGFKYRVSLGPKENNFSPNVNVVDEKYGGSLSAYADLNMENAKKFFTELTVLSRDDFQTDDGQPGVRVVTRNKQQALVLRQTFFFFGTGDRKYVVTGTALAEGGEALDEVVMQSMKTFRLH